MGERERLKAEGGKESGEQAAAHALESNFGCKSPQLRIVPTRSEETRALSGHTGKGNEAEG
jgi:hypothetical protein